VKKKEVPQDTSSLNNFTKELCYAVDETGKYTTDLSSGWNVKSSALDVAWKDIENRIALAKTKVLNGEVSPILYYMELKLMDMTILSAYTGFYKWTIKRHMKSSVFNGLSDKKLRLYADVFEITIDKLKNIELNES
jgi:hypothetical protein